MATVYLCSGNGDERAPGIVLENMLAEMRAAGRTALLIYSGNPPFTLEPLKIHQRDIVLRYFDHFASAQVPAIKIENLLANLSESRKRHFLLSEEKNFSDIVLYGGALPPATFFNYADELILFTNHDASSTGWVYNTLRQLPGEDPRKPVRVVIVNAPGHESAAVFFYLLKEEIETLLGREYPLSFAGNVKLDQDLVNAALPLGRTILEVFPGSRFHGEIKYLVRNVPLGKGAELKETLFVRLIDSMEKKPGA
jgi:hypothetical protein